MSARGVRDLLDLPSFCKSALVAIIRRVIRKEEEELKTHGSLYDKNSLRMKQAMNLQKNGGRGFLPSFSKAAEGWNHMFPVLEYLNMGIESMGNGAPPSNEARFDNQYDPNASVKSLDSATVASDTTAISKIGFTPLEYQLLSICPDIVTPSLITSATPQGMAYAVRSQWVGIASRHVVLLLSQSKECPSLTQAQTTVRMQSTYTELLPLLEVSKMTYADLEEGQQVESKSTSKSKIEGSISLFLENLM
tara:strand:- start:353 stop:1099 length:747 start_codon:yes stop_codon:yes gene_type:complete